MIQAGTLNADARIRDPSMNQWITWDVVLQQAAADGTPTSEVKVDPYVGAGTYDAKTGWYYMQGSAQSGPHLVHHISYLYNYFYFLRGACLATQFWE